MARKKKVAPVAADAGSRLVLNHPTDTSCSPALHAEALRIAAAGSDCTVDCSAIDFLGTAALQILVALKHELLKQGKALRFEAVSPPLERWLQVAGLHDLLLKPATSAA
jgi:anti-anti-sigma factor